jgi:hypothetical protein
MSLTTWFGWRTSAGSGADELPEIFPLGISQTAFITTDTVAIYQKIIVDVIERVHGLSEDIQATLWDNCMANEHNDGLVTMVAKAMAEKKELFIVYDKALKLIRKANDVETQTIKLDYKTRGESKAGVYVSFKNYTRTDMVILYSSLEYCTIAALNKNMNLSKALQIKINDLRASVGLADSAEAKDQARAMATALAEGRDILMDSKDIIETMKPDLSAVKESMAFLNEKRCFYLGLPASYITGQAPAGLGDSGEGDQKAIERGLKIYFFSVVKPILEAVFGVKPEYKSQDFRMLTSALEALKTFEITGEDVLSIDQKRIVMAKLLDFDLSEMPTGEATPEPAPAPGPFGFGGGQRGG